MKAITSNALVNSTDFVISHSMFCSSNNKKIASEQSEDEKKVLVKADS